MRQLLIFLAFVIGAFFATFAQSQMPAFVFTDLEGNLFTQDNLESDMPTVVMFFDPYCDHCETQAGWIKEAEDQFLKINLLFVTTEPETDATVAFKERIFKGTKLKQLNFVIDGDYMFDGYFEGYYEVPSILLFDKTGKKVKTLSKETPVADLLKHLK
jgi:thiol-disulfide isomerase/thioredoxin